MTLPIKLSPGYNNNTMLLLLFLVAVVPNPGPPTCPEARQMIVAMRTPTVVAVGDQVPAMRILAAATAAVNSPAIAKPEMPLVCWQVVQMWANLAIGTPTTIAAAERAWTELAIDEPTMNEAIQSLAVAVRAGDPVPWLPAATSNSTRPPPCDGAACTPALLSRPTDSDSLRYAQAIGAPAVRQQLVGDVWLPRGEALLAGGQASLGVAESLAQPSPSSAEQGLLLRLYSRLERYDDVARLARVLTDESLLVPRAQALAKAGATDEAVALFDQAIARDPSSAAGIAFSAAFALYEVRRYEEAQQRLRPLMAAATQWQELVHWYIPFMEVLRDRKAEAWDGFALLLQKFPAGKERRRGRYWQAVMGLSLGVARERQAKQALQKLWAEDPLDYVGQRAGVRLFSSPPVGSIVARQPSPSSPIGADIAHRWYWLGFDAQAQQAAVALGDDIDAVAAQQAVGFATRGWRHGPRFLSTPAARGGRLQSKASWRASYATPWEEQVESLSKAEDIAPSFVWAIMRTESGFDAAAVSHVGARGAMQLMPDTAAELAKELGVAASWSERLRDPPVVLRFGVALLGQHQRQFGSLALAAAAYNGGPAAAARWLVRYRDLDDERFVEHIPYRETRDYVKRVMAVEAVYRALDGEPLQLTVAVPPPPSPTTLPSPANMAPADRAMAPTIATPHR
jgi:soluble lytic murein transglycosylase-like protein